MADNGSRPPFDEEWDEEPKVVNPPSIPEGHPSDMLMISGEERVWLSSLGGALLNDLPTPTFEAKQLPEHDWLEHPGVEVLPSSGMLNATEITLNMSIAATGKRAIVEYTNFVYMMSGRFWEFYFPAIEQTWGSLLFARTSNPQYNEGAGYSFVNFDLTMRMTVPTITNGKIDQQ